jgi:serine-type D-Ala-D-Ala carboxypeptidase (penicillin-binding protein 5/6)
MNRPPKKRITKLKIFYSLILGIVFTVFILLSLLNIQIKQNNRNEETLGTPISFQPSDYPEINQLNLPEVSAQGALVLDKNSQVTLYQKNPTIRFSPASTTKIMTALVALEYFNLKDVLTIYQPNVAGSNFGFKSQEKFTFEDLLYAMMLPSSNEATLAIAHNYPGGLEAFVTRMNEKAKSLNLDDTYFEEPIGLADEKDYTTALDLARLTSVALENPIFSKVVSTKSWSTRSISGNRHTFRNINILLNLPGVSGVKTGFTEGAGQVLVTSKKIGGQELIFVVMQSEDRFADTEALINSVSNTIAYRSIHP